jgi:hypothetical protein
VRKHNRGRGWWSRVDVRFKAAVNESAHTGLLAHPRACLFLCAGAAAGSGGQDERGRGRGRRVGAGEPRVGRVDALGGHVRGARAVP